MIQKLIWHDGYSVPDWSTSIRQQSPLMQGIDDSQHYNKRTCLKSIAWHEDVLRTSPSLGSFPRNKQYSRGIYCTSVCIFSARRQELMGRYRGTLDPVFSISRLGCIEKWVSKTDNGQFNCSCIQLIITYTYATKSRIYLWRGMAWSYAIATNTDHGQFSQNDWQGYEDRDQASRLSIASRIAVEVCSSNTNKTMYENMRLGQA